MTKKVAAAPKVALGKKKTENKKDFKSTHQHLFPQHARDFRIGRDQQPKRDVSRFVRWPKYVRLQRQKAIINQRLKVPPAIAQFTRTLDKNQASNLFSLMAHYTPETRQQKHKRLVEEAKAEVKETKKEDKKEEKKEIKKKDEKKKGDKPMMLKTGINHIFSLVEDKKAKLVVIAHDVDPIELVIFLPALCRKMEVPYCIVKGKARLGQLVHLKTATALALTEVKKEHQQQLEQLVQSCRLMYNDNVDHLKKWGGNYMGIKHRMAEKKKKETLAKEKTAKSAKEKKN
eukprot:TRINITY_DN7384_c0_g1_i1.p1 TRINITY_DN7384_c0_g1~~TRINITY_DN7384_c0_g1_i1.p1  ORF type:complete len:299 (-),score=103.91 TRINITY_DN7384_c0_g1_i1:74-934(-)